MQDAANVSKSFRAKLSLQVAAHSSVQRRPTSHSSRPPASVPLINLVWRVGGSAFRAGGGSIPALDALRFYRRVKSGIRCVDSKPNERAVFESYFSSQQEFRLFVGSRTSSAVESNRYPPWG